MDPRRFDALAKSLSDSGTRRGLVRLLAALPLGVTLVSLLGDDPHALAEDDDHGSSHRHRRRKTRNARQSGDDKDNRTGKRKGKRKGKDKGAATNPVMNPTTNPVPTPCQGKADRECCGGAGYWCQGGACVAIPDDATATLRECGGQCDCPSTCGTPIPATRTVCGKVLTCTNCDECMLPPNNCANGFGFNDGPEGFALYCMTSFTGTGGFCRSHTDCPDPSTQGCATGVCTNICYGT